MSSAGKSAWWCLKWSRHTRLIRFLSRARFTFLRAITNPMRDRWVVEGIASNKSWLRFDLKTALSITALKSAGVSSLAVGGKRCSVTISDWNASDSQTLATFSTTTCENGATVFGGHACTETVSTLLFDSAWLESTLHDLWSDLFKPDWAERCAILGVSVPLVKHLSELSCWSLWNLWTDRVDQPSYIKIFRF